ncbi:molybdopterin-binding protein [Loktanella agnita]|uniref:molybdopterin-binding protein n=1 Tax=Loktanella agnita TaxID=287097 RepID=UPI003989F78A
MRFGPVRVADALGCVLAHAVPLAKGRLRKGTRVGPEEIAQLLAEGHETLTMARLDPGDMAEDDAAAALAAALVAEGGGLQLSMAATGRVNIRATLAGIVALDVPALHAFNGVNPMITVASLPPWTRVDPGTMVATVKVISYAVPGADVDRAMALGGGAIGQRLPRYKTATLIETDLDQHKPMKGRAALAVRLDRLGVALTAPVHVPHDAARVAEAVAKAPGEVVFILTASATSDAADVGPAGLVQAGGRLIQFGMPVDPGNLLFLGCLGDKPVIGLPGCARSPALNGADWVLERVICGLDLTPADFAAMGVGGLLKEIPSRPKPRGDIDESL